MSYTGSNLLTLLNMHYSIFYMSIYICRAKKKICKIYTDIILVMLFTYLYLICFTIVALGVVFEMLFSSLVSTHCNIKMFHCYLAPPRVDTTHDLGVL